MPPALNLGLENTGLSCESARFVICDTPFVWDAGCKCFTTLDFIGAAVGVGSRAIARNAAFTGSSCTFTPQASHRGCGWTNDVIVEVAIFFFGDDLCAGAVETIETFGADEVLGITLGTAGEVGFVLVADVVNTDFVVHEIAGAPHVGGITGIAVVQYLVTGVIALRIVCADYGAALDIFTFLAEFGVITAVAVWHAGCECVLIFAIGIAAAGFSKADIGW